MAQNPVRKDARRAQKLKAVRQSLRHGASKVRRMTRSQRAADTTRLRERRTP